MNPRSTVSGAVAELERLVVSLGEAMWTSVIAALPTRLRRDPDSAVVFLVFAYFAVAMTAGLVAVSHDPTARLFTAIGLVAAVYWMRQVWKSAGRP